MGKQELVNIICDAAYNHASSDIDISPTQAISTSNALEALLEACDILEGEDDSSYTSSLVMMWISFAECYGVPGGSVGDYCAEAVMKALREYNVHIRVSDYQVLDELQNWIEDMALEPEREIKILENSGVL